MLSAMAKSLVPQGRLPLVEKEIDGIGMGVLPDGAAYLSAKGLARLCGVAPSTLLAWEYDENSGNPRDRTVASLLAGHGHTEATLYEQHPSKNERMYPETACMAILEYYAFDVPRPQALRNYRKLSRVGLRLFVYHALGHDPRNQVPVEWRQFHDRVLLHQVPTGHWTVFQEMASIVLSCIRAGMLVDAATVPDISAGMAWGKHWTDDGLAAQYGERKKLPHNYPDYFPQAKSNPQEIWMYPNEALPEFRRWMDAEYLPSKFATYLDGKVRKKQLPPSVREMVLEAVESDRLLPSGQ